MRDEEEIRAELDNVIREYDKSAEGGMTPDSTYSMLRSCLEWVLGETDEPPVGD